MAPVGIGDRLRNARQALGLSFEEIESTTRIRRLYLEALEREAFGDLPSPTYVRGFLRSYAACLGISPGDLLELYPSSDAAPSVPRDAAVEVRITPAVKFSRTRRLLTVLGIVVGLGILVVGYVLYGQIRQFAQTATPAPSPTAPSPRGVTPAAPAPGGTVEVTPSVPPPGGAPGTRTPGASSPLPASPPAQPAPAGPSPAGESAAGPIHAVVVASARSWVRVVADGATVFEGFLGEGEQRTWDAARSLTVKAGNAGALEVSVNGRSLGRFGSSGEVLERTLTAGSAAP